MAVADDQTTAVANFDGMCIVTGEFPAVQAKVECLAFMTRSLFIVASSSRYL